MLKSTQYDATEVIVKSGELFNTWVTLNNLFFLRIYFRSAGNTTETASTTITVNNDHILKTLYISVFFCSLFICVLVISYFAWTCSKRQNELTFEYLVESDRWVSNFI